MLRDSLISLSVVLFCSLIPLTCTSCSGSVSAETPNPATRGLGPEAIKDLPGLPDITASPHTSSGLFAGEFLEIDEYESVGATWDMEGTQLSLAREGLSYSILGTLSPVFNALSITLDGDLDGLCLGISDYPRGSWRWLAASITGSTTISVPPEVGISPSGMLYVALVCPDGAAASLGVSWSFENDIVIPPEGLGEWPVVPDDLLEAYAELLDHKGDWLDFLESATLPQRRAFIYYKFINAQDVVLNKFTITSQPCELDEYFPQIYLIEQQISPNQGSDYYLAGMQTFVFYYPEEKTRAELAWTADWIIQHYPALFWFAQPVTLIFQP